jgi:hypothetical protein
VQVGQYRGVDILGHYLEVVEVSILISRENLTELASALLGEVESINLGIDEDAGSEIVRIVQERIMLEGFCTGLKAEVSLRSSAGPLCAFANRNAF